MAPAGHEHGHIAHEVAFSLGLHVKANKLRRVYAAETGFKLASNPDTMRAPDVAFVSRERLQEVTSGTGYFPGPPDLAVEIVSPNDRHGEVEERVGTWLHHGVRIVVTVNPQSRTAMVYRSPDEIRMLSEGRLEGATVSGAFHSMDLPTLFSAKACAAATAWLGVRSR